MKEAGEEYLSKVLGWSGPDESDNSNIPFVINVRKEPLKELNTAYKKESG